jgi:hypothetical protein
MFRALKVRKVKITKGIGSFVGFTLYPYILYMEEGVLPHEMIHIKQQEAFWKKAGPLGLLAWLALYFLVLPVGWNPFRRKWETEAYKKGSKYSPEMIEYILRKSYFLRW